MENEKLLTPPTDIEGQSIPLESSEAGELPPSTGISGDKESDAPQQELSPEQKRAMIIGIILFVFLLIALVGSVIYLANQPGDKVAHIRDIFIIFMAFMSLMTSLVLVILILQMARLINLLQNEVKPLLDSLNETISNMRGTTAFLSDNLTEPIIKLNEYLTGITTLFQTIGLFRRTSKTKSPKGE